jgi:hypothetical protein
MFVLPTVSVRGVAVTSGAWSAMYRNDSMLILVEESSQKFVLLGRVNGSSSIKDELLNGALYFELMFDVFAAIVISGNFFREEQFL